MDNSAVPSGGTREWATPMPGAIALTGVGIALIVAAAASYQDPPAMLLLSIAALGVIVFGVLALVRRPRLRLEPGPRLGIRTLRGWWELDADDVASVEIIDARRLLFHSQQLMLESTEGRLAVFTRWDLGESPRAVAEDLWAAGYPERPAPATR